MRQPSDPHAAAEAFNALHQVGKPVRYYPVLNAPEYRVRTTRTPAHVLSGHTAVVFLDGERGCVAVSNLKPTDGQERPESNV